MNNLYENIENYLNGSMSDAEKKVFEEAMQKDKALQEKVQIQAGVHRFLEQHNSEFNTLNAELSDEFFPNKKSKPTFYIQIGIALIILVLAYLYYKNHEIIHSKLFNKSNTSEGQIPSIQNNNQLDTISLPSKATNKKDTIPSSEEDVKLSTEPIADAANTRLFKENPQLELLIRENIRSNNNDITVIKPIEANIISSKTSDFTLFELTGSFNRDFNYKVEFYDNSRNAYAEDRFILIRNQRTANQKIQLNINLSFSKGLYYYFVILEDTNMPIFTGKFIVRE